jgi:3-oxoadipate enol-lactonase
MPVSSLAFRQLKPVYAFSQSGTRATYAGHPVHQLGLLAGGRAMSDQSRRADQKPGEVRSVRAPDGARIEYEVVGTGPPLVMLHGLLASRFAFSRQRTEFADHYRLIMLSARGHDGSDTIVPANYGLGLSDVDDLRAVLDAEQLECVNLFAHSSGGATAFVFARQSPERVARQVLLEPTLLALLPAGNLAQTVAENESVVAVGESKGPEACMRAAIALAAGEAWTKLDEATQTKRLRGMASIAPMVGPHLRGLGQLPMKDTDVLDLRPPTLLLYGADSFPWEALIADRIRALRPDLRVVTVDKAAHNLHRDRSDIVNAEALAFLAA